MPIPARTIAEALLAAGAVLLRPDQPFTFASGIRSPVYCDNRLLLGNVAVRRLIADAFAEQCANADVLAGPATGGIAWAAWAGERLDLPMAYVRSSAKAHGRGQQIEGAAVANRRVVVLEDTISTGESAIQAVHALREAAATVERCICIFTWGWEVTRQTFRAEQLELVALATLQDLLLVATDSGQLDAEKRAIIERWADNPKEWQP
jgi:orotate phosphoribosyltransferase